MAAVFIFGPVGGLNGLVGGLWLGLRLADGQARPPRIRSSCATACACGCE